MKCYYLNFLILNVIFLPLGFSVTVRNALPVQREYNANNIDASTWKALVRDKLPVGQWATPPPELGIHTGFTPVQTYLQVRRTNSIQHLPRSEAWKESASEDELLNAHRLKEVVRTKKVQEVYSEEGFEDSAYDHGNHEREAEHDESFNQHKDGQYRLKDVKNSVDDSSNSESKINEKKSNDPKVNKNRIEKSTMEMKYAQYPKKFKRAYVTKRKYNPQNFIQIPTIPTYGYIHSLTDGFYKKLPSYLPPSRTIPSNIFNRRKKRDVEVDDEADAVKETEKYEKELSDELDQQQGAILKSTYDNLGPYKTFLQEGDNAYKSESQEDLKPTRFKIHYLYDKTKYPFFERKDINPDSPLRYASNPKEFPKKSGLNMEWYSQKDQEVNCPEVSFTHTGKNNPKRIIQLGDKIECMKNKYFGEEPLDSPFFSDPIDRSDALYEYRPNRTMHIIIQRPDDNYVQSSEEKPNYEVVERENFTVPTTTTSTASPIEITTKQIIPRMSLVVLPHKMKKYMNRHLRMISYPKPCVYPVHKMSVTKRSDVFIDCLDVSMMQTTKDGHEHIKIFPKRSKLDYSWLPPSKIRSGEVLEGVFPRYRKKRSTNARSSLFPKKSLLDKITKRSTTTTSTTTEKPKNITQIDLGIHSPEELHNLTTTTEQSFKIEPKKLSRLSGKAFLDRYHGKKKLGKDDFWTTQKTMIEPTPMLLYFVDQTTGSGKWVSQISTETMNSSFEKPKPVEPVREKQNATTKQEMRKQFFRSKLNKKL